MRLIIMGQQAFGKASLEAVLKKGVDSYRAYQEHELREVRAPPLALLRANVLMEVSGAGAARGFRREVEGGPLSQPAILKWVQTWAGD